MCCCGGARKRNDDAGILDNRLTLVVYIDKVPIILSIKLKKNCFPVKKFGLYGRQLNCTAGL